MKTAKEIQSDIRALLLSSPLAEEVSGQVYRAGYRPRDSQKEDIVITFTAGLPGQIQTGVVTVNIFVPDIDPDADGTWVEDGARTSRLERALQDWTDSLTAARSGYIFAPAQTVMTHPAPELRQHFIALRLSYRLLE